MSAYHLNLTNPTFTLIRVYADRSGILNAYGPFESEDLAKAAAVNLEEVGIDITGAWEITKTWSVEKRDDDETGSSEPLREVAKVLNAGGML